ncbi:MAG TPA: hypothetical protein VNJ04_02825 [Gemmatimonadaceae bacterium]|nr:hypothetical protein [Gemmatimonadaceae bacterium]
MDAGTIEFVIRMKDQMTATLANIRANLGTFGREAQAAGAALSAGVGVPVAKAGGLFNDLSSQVQATALGFVGAQAIIGGVTAAFSALTAFVGDSVASFAAAEVAQKRLTTALRTQGGDVPRLADQYGALAAQFQRTTTFSDDLITEMQALLVQVGNVAPSEMQKALKAATDLSSGLGVDLRAATMLVGKAFEGETVALKRYGLVIDDAKLAAEGIQPVLDAIQAKFGGQAAAEIETYSGKVAQLANAWDDVKESVGKSIVDDALLIRAIKEITGQVNDLSGAAAASQPTMTEWWARVVGGDQAGMAIAWMSMVLKLQDDITVGMQRLQASTPTPALFAGGPGKPGMFSGASLDIDGIIAGWNKADTAAAASAKRAAAAAKAHAEAMQRVLDTYTGQAAIATARIALDNVTKAMQQGIPIAQMSKEKQTELNRTMGDAIDVYVRTGKTVPPAMLAVYGATWDLAEITKTLPRIIGEAETSFTQFGRAIEPFKNVVGDINRLITPLALSMDQIVGAEGFGKFISQWDIAPPKIEEVSNGIGELSSALANLAQVSGGAFGGIVSDLSRVVSAIDSAQKGMDAFKAGKKAGGSEGFLGMTAGILGMASAALTAVQSLKQLYQILDTVLSAVSRARNDFVSSFADPTATMYDPQTGRRLREVGEGATILREQLKEAGAEGERLWQSLMNAKSAGDVTRAMAAIRTALANTPAALAGAAGYKTMAELQAVADKAQKTYEFLVSSGKYSAEQIASAFKVYQDAARAAMSDSARAAIAASEAMTTKIKTDLDTLKGTRDSLVQSIANEAPEEVMGVIEAETRARIAQVEAEMAAKKAQLDAAASAGQAAIDQVRDDAVEVNDYVREMFGKPMRIPIEWIYDTPQMPGFAGGTRGYQNFGSGTPVMLHGWEKVTPLGKDSGSAGAGGARSTNIQLVTPDGRTLWSWMLEQAAVEGIS